eukprot:1195875-Prorocentrum_minimum.AAC.3
MDVTPRATMTLSCPTGKNIRGQTGWLRQRERWTFVNVLIARRIRIRFARLPCRGGQLPCRGGRLPCRGGRLTCREGRLTCQEGRLTCREGRLTCLRGRFLALQDRRKRSVSYHDGTSPRGTPPVATSPRGTPPRGTSPWGTPPVATSLRGTPVRNTPRGSESGWSEGGRSETDRWSSAEDREESDIYSSPAPRYIPVAGTNRSRGERICP